MNTKAWINALYCVTRFPVRQTTCHKRHRPAPQDVTCQEGKRYSHTPTSCPWDNGRPVFPRVSTLRPGWFSKDTSGWSNKKPAPGQARVQAGMLAYREARVGRLALSSWWGPGFTSDAVPETLPALGHHHLLSGRPESLLCQPHEQSLCGHRGRQDDIGARLVPIAEIPTVRCASPIFQMTYARSSISTGHCPSEGLYDFLTTHTIRRTRTSITFVSVSPVRSRSPVAAKKG